MEEAVHTRHGRQLPQVPAKDEAIEAVQDAPDESREDAQKGLHGVPRCRRPAGRSYSRTRDTAWQLRLVAAQPRCASFCAKHTPPPPSDPGLLRSHTAGRQLWRTAAVALAGAFPYPASTHSIAHEPRHG